MEEVNDTNVHNQSYYDVVPGYQAIDIIHASTKDLPSEIIFDVGTTEKYLLRLGKKIEPTLTLKQMLKKDLSKAREYIDYAIKQVDLIND